MGLGCFLSGFYLLFVLLGPQKGLVFTLRRKQELAPAKIYYILAQEKLLYHYSAQFRHALELDADDLPQYCPHFRKLQPSNFRDRQSLNHTPRNLESPTRGARASQQLCRIQGDS